MHPLQHRLKLFRTTARRRASENYFSLLSTVVASHCVFDDLKHLVEKRDVKGLLDAADSMAQQQYESAEMHFLRNQFSLLIKKYPFPREVSPYDPEAKAQETFLTSERRCQRVNRRFRLRGNPSFRSSSRWSREIGKMKFYIRTVLGSDVNFSRVFSEVDLGKGASLGVHGNATNFLRKISVDRLTVTPGALHHSFLAITKIPLLLEEFLPRGPGDLVCYDLEYAFKAYLERIELVNNNKLSFVPKTAKTHRVIAVEPLLNGLCQKGIDQFMRHRLLRKVGIDLSDQGWNQELARLGSLDDSEEGYATIDLKSASDSISIELVRTLLPDSWFRLLDRTRSPCYSLNGVVRRYDKFCSMGNGFCFPLETLLFAAACFAISDSTSKTDYSVYGDDIAIRKRWAPRLIQLLNYMGFKTNADKTFLEGPFRESCGRDWYGGKDVRPFTLDYALDSIQNIFKFLNCCNRSERTTTFFAEARNALIESLPRDLRLFRPLPGDDESAITSTGDEHLTCRWTRYRNGKWSWVELQSVPVLDREIMLRNRGKPSRLMVTALRGAPSSRERGVVGIPEVTLRNQPKTKVVRKSYVAVSNWLPPLRAR